MYQQKPPRPERESDPLPGLHTAELNDLSAEIACLCSDLYTACIYRRGRSPEHQLDGEQVRERMRNLGRWLLDAAGEPADLPFLVPHANGVAHARN